MTPLVTMEVFRVPWPRVPAALARMASDRRRLARVEGLRFWRLLGTGDGQTFDLRDADLRTWALLAVWAQRAAAARYAAASPVAAGWRRLAEEAWRAELRPIAARGRWAGRAPFQPVGGSIQPVRGSIEPVRGSIQAVGGSIQAVGGSRHDAGVEDRAGGPVAAITRARLRPGRMRAFWRAVPPVTADLRRQPGLRLSLGIGEAPAGLQGTFSVWASAPDLDAFAYRGAAHREAIAATAREGWYAEELFARFAVEATRGTVFGRDPAEA